MRRNTKISQRNIMCAYFEKGWKSSLTTAIVHNYDFILIFLPEWAFAIEKGETGGKVNVNAHICFFGTRQSLRKTAL